MKGKLTTSEFHVVAQKMKSEYSISQCRRWVRDALPPDENAKQRSGYIRRFSYFEGLLVLVFGFLIDERKLDKKKGKIIIDNIAPWVKEKVSPIEEYHDHDHTYGWELFVVASKDALAVEAKKTLDTKYKDGRPLKWKLNKEVKYVQEGIVELVVSKNQPPPQCLNQSSYFTVIIPISDIAWGYSISLKEYKQ